MMTNEERIARIRTRLWAVRDTDSWYAEDVPLLLEQLEAQKRLRTIDHPCNCFAESDAHTTACTNSLGYRNREQQARIEELEKELHEVCNRW